MAEHWKAIHFQEPEEHESIQRLGSADEPGLEQGDRIGPLDNTSGLAPFAEQSGQEVLTPGSLNELRGRDLVEALIARDTQRIREQYPEATMALRAVRRKYESDAARIDGAYHFMKAKGLVKKQPR